MKHSNRIISLDVFRGLVVAAMIVVNSPGYNTSFAWLTHSSWHGCTLADLIFPFFLFIVGISLVLALSSSLKNPEKKRTILIKIIKRVFFLFTIGLILNLIPSLNFETLRFYGVLQRIALCYLVAGILFLYASKFSHIVLTIGILISYWLIMTVYPVPEFGAGDLSPAGNLAALLDRLLFSPTHLYGTFYDPEGFLSTFPAIATTLSGLIFGRWFFNSSMNPEHKVYRMLLVSLGLSLGGYAWGLFFPINKSLWTSSYVLWADGWALLSFSVLYWIIDIKQWKNGFYPLRLLGQYALSAYVLHVLFLKIQVFIKIKQLNGSFINLKQYLSRLLFGWAPDNISSLLYALSYTLFCLGIIALFHIYTRDPSK
ncbi:acyltransferase family protein [Legionella yabuuchiae]|uniref:acyltransferase family protein n=1 Tax=Legionella yabuuchiae TaxID=376727 RepID=UPI001056CE14|nr:heparan-alpha-glucosaminide N-acetyltransferase domain-containing protein [Legionella yabuuchiae]